MRLPKLPGRGAADEATPTEAPAAPQQHTNIISAVPMPEPVPPPLTSELTRSIRFTISEPQGYYFEQVETFVQQVIDVLAFYEAADDRWRQYAYEMQLEVDQQAYDAQRLRSEIELFKVQGSPLVNPDGSYMTESQNSTLAAVSADLNLVKDQLSASEQARLVGQEEINRLQDLAAMRDQEIASLRAWGAQVIADMQALQAHATNLEGELAAAQTALHSAQSAQAVPAAPVVQAAPAAPVIEPVAPPVIEPVIEPVITPVMEAVTGPVIEPVEAPANEVHVTDVVAPAPVVPADPIDVAPLDPHVPVIDVPVIDAGQIEALDHDGDGGDGDGGDGGDGDIVAVSPAAPEAQFYTPAEQPAPSPTGYQPSLYVPAGPVIEPPVIEVPGYDPEAVTVAPVLAPEPVTVDYSPDVEPPVAVEVPVMEAPVVEVPVVEVDAADYDYDEDDYEADDEAEDADGDNDWALDSELPEGVSLPGTGEAAYSYPAAAPGAPLETHGVPMGVWAPELDPRITQALAEEARQQQTPTSPATGEPAN